MGKNSCFSLFMAVIILVQGCVYLGLSVWGFTLSECSNTTSVASIEPIKLVFKLVYFKKSECFPLTIPTNLTQQPLELKFDSNRSDQITDRTYIILICYAVVSSLWILTSLLVISSTCGPLNKLVAAICFWSWYFAVFAGSILDVVASCYHANDLLNTMNIENALDYIGILSDESKEILRPLGILLTAPALIFTCLSSRFILLWLFNTCGSCVCISLYRKVTPAKRRNIKDGQSVSRSRKNETQASSKNDKLQKVTEPVTEKQMGTDSAEDVIAIISKSGSSGPQTSQNPSKNDNSKQFIPAKLYQLQRNPSNIRSQPLVLANNQQNNEAADIVITSQLKRTPSKLNAHNNSSSDMLRVRPIPTPKDQPISHINMYPNAIPNTRYITPHEYYPPYTPNERQIHELRGQMPWSYINMPNEASRVNIYPDIPSPDY